MQNIYSMLPFLNYYVSKERQYWKESQRLSHYSFFPPCGILYRVYHYLIKQSLFLLVIPHVTHQIPAMIKAAVVIGINAGYLIS